LTHPSRIQTVFRQFPQIPVERVWTDCGNRVQPRVLLSRLRRPDTSDRRESRRWGSVV